MRQARACALSPARVVPAREERPCPSGRCLVHRAREASDEFGTYVPPRSASAHPCVGVQPSIFGANDAGTLLLMTLRSDASRRVRLPCL